MRLVKAAAFAGALLAVLIYHNNPTGIELRHLRLIGEQIGVLF